MALEMKIEQQESAGGPVEIAVVHGSLTMGTNLKTVDHNLQAMIAAGGKRLVLDLTGVPYCDSAGLGLLMHAAGLVTSGGGVMRICGASERVMDLLKITRTDTLLPLDADRAASLAKLDGGLSN